MKFVPEGSLEGGWCVHPMSCFLTCYQIAPGPILKQHLPDYYGKGFSLLSRQGWKSLDDGPIHAEPPVTPLEVVYIPPRPIVSREQLQGELGVPVSIVRGYQGDVSIKSGLSLLPHIHVTIYGEPTVALVDSGSEVTCINEKFLQQLTSTRVVPILPAAST